MDFWSSLNFGQVLIGDLDLCSMTFTYDLVITKQNFVTVRGHSTSSTSLKKKMQLDVDVSPPANRISLRLTLNPHDL